MGKLWELKQAAAAKALDLYIYSDVESDGYDWWSGETIQSETSATYFRDALADAGDVEQINIYINSLGGSVMEGTSIYNQLKRHPAQKTVYIDGFACSVASVIAMAGDKIIMPKNTAMMIHNMWTICIGNAKDMRKAADDLDVLMEANRQAYLQKAGDKLTEEKLIEMLEAETWLTAEQCIEFGLADEFAGTEANIEDAKATLNAAKANLTRQSLKTLFAAKAQTMPDGSTNPEQNAPETDPEDNPEEDQQAQEGQKPDKPDITEKLQKLVNAFASSI